MAERRGRAGGRGALATVTLVSTDKRGKKGNRPLHPSSPARSDNAVLFPVQFWLSWQRRLDAPPRVLRALIQENKENKNLGTKGDGRQNRKPGSDAGEKEGGGA